MWSEKGALAAFFIVFFCKGYRARFTPALKLEADFVQKMHEQVGLQGSLLGQGGQPRDISQKTSWGTPSVIYLLNALDERSSFLGCPTPKSLIWFLPTRRGTAPFINP